MIHWARVEELYEDFGEDAFVDVIEVFMDEAEESLDRLRRAQTPQAHVVEFHFLKGAALNLGLTEMAEACARGEREAGAGQDVTDARDAVLTGFPTACHELQQTWRARILPG